MRSFGTVTSRSDQGYSPTLSYWVKENVQDLAKDQDWQFGDNETSNNSQWTA